MKYYETIEPFYSLIFASDAEEAKVIYRKIYGDQDDPDIFEEISREEAEMRFNIGDWIATGTEGEHWVIRDAIFRKTYDEAQDD